MSKTKKLPDDIKINCLALVKGYARRKAEYQQKRDSLMHNTPDNVVTVKDKEDPENESKQIGVMIGGSRHASRTTEDITERILGLEKHPDTRRMRAVEYAAKRIGLDLPEDKRQQLVSAIFTSCIQGRKYPFERLNVEGMERSCFYDRRMRFLIDIAKFMDMI